MPLTIFNNSASFTRPNDTTAYSANDLVANLTTAGSVDPLAIPVGGYSGMINLRLVRARLTKSGTSATNANFRIHLYSQSPTCANGDNAAWSTNDAAYWLGNIDVTSVLALTDGCAGVGSLAAGSEAFLHTGNVTGAQYANPEPFLSEREAFLSGSFR
jgi:hypothetical protein